MRWRAVAAHLVRVRVRVGVGVGDRVRIRVRVRVSSAAAAHLRHHRPSRHRPWHRRRAGLVRVRIRVRVGVEVRVGVRVRVSGAAHTSDRCHGQAAIYTGEVGVGAGGVRFGPRLLVGLQLAQVAAW